ncbi:amidase family protein [Roseateles toxinivorans]|uniref:Amidase n=1 Tax=Roseateles toxinivorans TaxID=270368 RepID=A0A4R6QHE1_9BURK|nr:amidase family protein [Roseateles toxinivorans]TDP62057.1 amidase [Roseateles toxinivorans]
MDRLIEESLRLGSIAQWQALLVQRRISVVEALQWTLARIAALSQIPSGLNALGAVCEHTLAQAQRADARLRHGQPLGPLFGVPVLLKDNILTTDGLPASAGAAALAGFIPQREARIAARLRQAGALIIGKAHMTEFADYVSDTMPAGFSGAAGMVLNPFTRVPYARGQGSSVGCAAAVSAGIVPLAIGTETQNSIQTPAHHSSVVGFKPSVGMVSRAGIVPLVPSQDSPGPIARNVPDAALALRCLGGVDPGDAATLPVAHVPPVPQGAAQLKNVRVGVPRRAMADRADFSLGMQAFETFLARLSAAGAVIVDPCDLPTAPAVLDLRSSVFATEFKQSLNEFLRTHGSPQGIGSLADLIVWNQAHPECVPFGQSLLLNAQATRGTVDPAYRADRERDLRLCRDEGIDFTRAHHRVDVLVAPMGAAAKFTGKAGAPAVALPAGLGGDGLPFGVTVFSSTGCDAELLRIAAAMQIAAGQRVLPIDH